MRPLFLQFSGFLQIRLWYLNWRINHRYFMTERLKVVAIICVVMTVGDQTVSAVCHELEELKHGPRYNAVCKAGWQYQITVMRRDNALASDLSNQRHNCRFQHRRIGKDQIVAAHEVKQRYWISGHNHTATHADRCPEPDN